MKQKTHTKVTPAKPATQSVEVQILEVDDPMTECHLAMPKLDEQNSHPFQFKTLAHYQNNDATLMALPNADARFAPVQFGQEWLICFHYPDGDYKIAIPDGLLPQLVQYYHGITCHAEGVDRLETSIRRHFYHPRLCDEIRTQMARCPFCPKVKKGARQYGDLAPRQAHTIPWNEVHADSIGPWKIRLGGFDIEVNALTMIDPVTNLVEIVRQYSKTVAENSQLFQNAWLARYPRPSKLATDNGPEFVGQEWEQMLNDHGIRRGRIFLHTPTSNAVVESMHKCVGQIVRTLVQYKRPTTQGQVDILIQEALAQSMHVCQCASSSSLGGYSPGSFVFGRDMLLNIPVVADLAVLNYNRQVLIDERVRKENAKRVSHEFRVGDNVYVQDQHSASDKLHFAYVGPFPIVQVHTNNTVTIQRGQIHERLSIRRIKPSTG